MNSQYSKPNKSNNDTINKDVNTDYSSACRVDGDDIESKWENMSKWTYDLDSIDGIPHQEHPHEELGLGLGLNQVNLSQIKEATDDKSTNTHATTSTHATTWTQATQATVATQATYGTTGLNKLSVNTNPDDIGSRNENEYESSLSESLVTHEELQSVRHQKQSAASQGNRTTHQELRILQAIYDSRISPAIALVPLGTGNDLSRCLGTGIAYPGSKELVTNLVEEYKQSDVTKLDRWKIQFMDNSGEVKQRQTSEMLCYFSIGFEGQVAYNFHQARSKNPKLLDRRWKNKIQYAISGIGASVEEAFNITKPLNNDIEVYVDGERLKLPSKTRSFVVSNIQSMADGVYYWGNGPNTKKDITTYTKPELGDGKLEVMSSKGIHKWLQLKMGMSHYRRLAQPKKVTIIMKNELAIQLDGESWMESPGVVEIYLLHQVFAVVGKNEPRGVRII